jgi:hypothetical protein
MTAIEFKTETSNFERLAYKREARTNRDRNAAVNIARIGCDTLGARKLRPLGRGGITERH